MRYRLKSNFLFVKQGAIGPLLLFFKAFLSLLYMYNVRPGTWSANIIEGFIYRLHVIFGSKYVLGPDNKVSIVFLLKLPAHKQHDLWR